MSGTIKKNYLVPMSGLYGIGMAAACAIGLTGFAQSAQATLLHEYSFNSGTISNGSYYTPDSIGGASYQATIMGTGGLSGGQVTLTNNNVQTGQAGLAYVSLPVSALPTTSPTVSFEEWFTGSYDYQSGTSGSVYAQNRGFDFNNDTLATATDAQTASPNQTTGSYLFQALDTGNGSGAGISAAGWGSGSALNTGYVAPGSPNYYSHDWLTQPGSNGQPLAHMIAVVIDQTPTVAAPDGTLTYYVDGIQFGSVNLTAANQWTAVAPTFTNAWLGRSAFNTDGVFNGTIDEFRIYNNALSASQVAADAAAGPNTVLTPEPASLALFGLAGASLLLIRRRRAAV